MTPLQKIAMGLVIVVLTARFGGYDALPDVLGWVLVVLGVLALRRVLPDTDTLLLFAVLAGALSVRLYVPDLAGSLDPALEWFLSLPQALFTILLSRTLAAHATAAGDPGAATRFRWLGGVLIVVALAPTVVFGADVTALRDPVGFLAAASLVVLIYQLFRHSTRAWAVPAPTGTPE